MLELYAILMGLVLASRLAAAMGNSDFGHPFVLLPKQTAWSTIAAESNATEITEMVHSYIQPFTQYQLTARNLSIPTETIKDNIIAALELLIEASKSFVVPKSEYEEAKKDIESSLKLPLTIFTLKRAKAVEPTFNPEALADFTRIRLKHLLTHKEGYMNFLVAKYQYEGTLNEWQITATRLPKCKFRGLLARNLDMKYIEHMLAVYLDAMRLKELDRRRGKPHRELPTTKKIFMKFHKDTLIKHMESLGNGYAVSKPPYSAFMVFATTLYAILITVMI